MRAGGEGASVSNLGVLVTHVRTPSPPSVGLRSCVRCECLAASSHRHGGAAAAARPVGAHAGPACPGGGAVAGCDDVRSRLALRCRAATCTMRSDEDRPTFAKRHLGGLDHQVKEMAAAGVQFGRWALTQDPALALKISQAASPCARPLMASSLKQDSARWGKDAAL